MDRLSITALLRDSASEMGVPLGPDQLEQFWCYLQELQEWNQRYDLTAITDPQDIVIKHFVDSLTPLPLLGPATDLVDVGSGAGFPGIPLKIASPSLRIQLLDAKRRKVSFLKHVIRTLGLSGITAHQGRIEEFSGSRLTCEVLISRAFQRPAPLLRLVSPVLVSGATAVAMLGPTGPEDLSHFQDVAGGLGFQLSRWQSLNLPRGRGGRTLLFFLKV